LITSLGYTKHKKNNKHNENSKKNTEPIIAKTTYDHTVIIENLKEHKTPLSSIFLFGELV